VGRGSICSRFPKAAFFWDHNSAQPGGPGFAIMRFLPTKAKSARPRANRKVKHPAAPSASASALSEAASPRGHADLFAHGIALFNSRHFFEAHEAWEEIWLHTHPPEKTFLQGLIQVTAAFHHHSRNNLRGTKSLLRAGLDKLDAFPANHRGLHIDRLRGAVRDWLAALHQENNARQPALPKITAAAHSH
jgi:predicted metal-dependent hydrolase